ncbi:3-phosphoshikimate 1-carboxyvinyltransferase [Achromobacter xylosoxidans]|uniref:3-phosphoshikimate 1-carboxyvinyltransferase n=1 Tax=Alcaligenes xylosoxydans xylosoxydans TaxID=85698 RepID=UPI001F1322D1|nr:3-phosphoshikimate 1-carboxyvinyltransferase [Achromobacter xylosoxidans]
MYLRVEPIKELGTRMNVPASKPETQRAILAATLADGTSIIRNDLRCTETETMKIACAQLGAKIEEAADALFVTGTGGRFASGIEVIDAKGSGLVFRTMMALSCVKSTPTILTGDATLRRRVMQPLLDGLRHLGANFAYLGDEGKAPVINWGASLTGRHCRLAGDISSQFITAILMAAPLTRQGISLEVTPPVLSQSYLAQTVETLRQCGIDAQVNPEYTRYHVAPGVYQPFETRINADYTSLSYLLMACALFPGRYRIGGIEQETLQGEKLFADIVQALGAQLRYEAGALHVDSTSARLEGNYTFDVRDGPNVIPTLVALSLFVRGTFTVTGGSVTRFHKSSRVESMIGEVRKLGADIDMIRNIDGHIDGFVTRGRPRYAGGVTLSSRGDHRNFMSLFVASLRCEEACHLDGYADVICSFPDFIDQFRGLGVSCATARQYYLEAADE